MPSFALPPLERRVPPLRRALPLPHRSYGLMRQTRLALPSFGFFSLVRGVFAGRSQPLLPTGSSRRYLCESFLGCLIPYPGGSTKCFYLFLPLWHRPSPRRKRVGFRSFSRTRLSTRQDFGAADISLCSGLQVCSSPRSFLPLLYCRRAAETFTSGQNVLRYLCTHRIC